MVPAQPPIKKSCRLAVIAEYEMGLGQVPELYWQLVPCSWEPSSKLKCQSTRLHFNKYARAVKPQQYIAKELASAAVTVRPRDDPELSITTLTYTAIGCLSNVVNCPASPQTIVKNTLPKTLTGAETVPTAKGGFVSAIALLMLKCCLPRAASLRHLLRPQLRSNGRPR
ncbi:uncharacterized protein RSE6_05840 [Rhynchosporium secalis]|uniref:Uncharacterized protein n=1 Tax=Rhynchosporium secalis TaxID=38038 RepID=A0A1E1M8W0_RHYSE|nr:uncharacterized protein RSE6_05840 [Rhynchosporium secalis]